MKNVLHRISFRSKRHCKLNITRRLIILPEEAKRRGVKGPDKLVKPLLQAPPRHLA
ncbi:Hypothetical protein ABZS17D1_01025 [Kosakonia cowanii]